MQDYPLAKIQISDNRQRREFDDQLLMDLTDSIRSNGLIHPVVIRDTAAGPILVAGERRLRAIKTLFDLGEGFNFDGRQYLASGNDPQIPTTTVGELGPLAAEEAELEENLRRVDLSWQERADATLRLKNLRDKQALAEGKPLPTLEVLAEDLPGRREGYELKSESRPPELSKTLLVARNLSDPDVAKAKTLLDAFKIVRRKEDNRKNEELALVLGRTFTAKNHELINGSSRDWLAEALLDVTAVARRFDVILCDPPYGMGADEFGDAGGKLITQTHEYKDTYEHWQELMDWFCPMSFRIAKPEAHIYVFCDIERFVELRDRLFGCGWRTFRTPIVVHKTDGNRAPWPEHGPQRKFELCAYGTKGNKRVNSLKGDVISCTGDENFGHGAQKPVALYRELLSRSVRPGNSVADFFCGTGPIFPAAHELKCNALGVELDAGSYAIAAKRIQKLGE